MHISYAHDAHQSATLERLTPTGWSVYVHSSVPLVPHNQTVYT
jgi:hypothetical protein